ncbi:hypothetical protein BH23GEM9_BH23GEM9_26370 [soil metagenome]
MKFLCIGCDTVMAFAERQLPGDGTMAAVFTCGSCGREVAMLTNPMETQLVSSLGIKVGGRTVPEQPMELLRGSLATGGAAFADEDPAGTAYDVAFTGESGGGAGAPVRVTWSADAQERLSRVPSFVRGMVKRIYADYARERGIATITPAIMDRARTELGLEGM